MVNQFKYIGSTFPIHDAAAKARGETKYVGDMKLPNMLHAKLLLSPIAHGIITRIDTSRAEKLPGVVRIFTYLNSPDKPFNRYRTVPNQECCPEEECLFTCKVRFVGDRVAAVVAESEAIAKKAVRLIEVEYEEWPVMVNPAESLKEGAADIHTGGNLIDTLEFTRGGSIKGQEQQTVTVESFIKTQKMHHAAIETHAYVASFNSGKLTIWTPTQGVYGVRTVVADLLNMKYNNVRVIKVPIGGSFGGKQEFFLDPLAAFLAKETRGAVRLQLDRRENIIATTARPAIESKMKTMVTKDGQLLAWHIENLFDAGAYISSSLDQAHAMFKKLLRLYRIPYYHHKIKVVYTNTTVSGGMRGWGATEIMTPIEIHMNLTAKALKLDPVEFRLKNLVHPFDVDKGTNISLGNCRVIECLEKGAASFNWRDRFNAGKSGGRYRRGVGVACGAHKNGMFGSFPEFCTMTLRMNEDGSFNLISTLHDVGCGTLTVMRLIIGEVLDIDPDLIVATEGDTEFTPYDVGCYGSRTTFVSGACAQKVAESVKTRILEAAAAILQKPKEYLQIANGQVWVIGEEEHKLSYGEIATRAILKYHFDIHATETYTAKSNPGAQGVHFAEVEVDTMTGLVRVTDYLAVHDIGKAINRGMVEGQIQGAAQMGIGYALCEEIKTDANGRVINDSFRKYNVVNAPDMPDVKVLLIEEGGDDGPFGAKSIGEISTVPSAAAVVNAVNHALGTSLTDLPLTPEKIIEALRMERGA